MVLNKFDILSPKSQNIETFTHGYYQGLIINIGNMKHFSTYVPAQDQNRKFLDKPLVDICSSIVLPDFSYHNLTKRASTVDVIWFNERTTDIQNSVAKFCDLRDFYSQFYIVAPKSRKEQFLKVMDRSAFKEMKDRIKFSSYETICKEYEAMSLMQNWTDKI